MFECNVLERLQCTNSIFSVLPFAETPLFQKPVCPTVTNLSSISLDIGCEADFNHTVLRKLQTLIMKCRPVVEDATCKWSYKNIVLGNSTDYAVSPGNHKFKVIAYPVTSLEIDIGSFTYLPGNTITCTCYSPTIDKSESRSTRITSPDFLDGRK